MRYYLIAISALALTAPLFSMSGVYTQRSEKDHLKRREIIAKLTPEAVAKMVMFKEDAMEPLVKASTIDVFTWRGGFTNTVRSDNFIRVLLDKAGEEVSYQLYQTISYSSDARRFERVNVMMPAGLETKELTVINHDVQCMSGVCGHTETVGFNLSEDEVAAVATMYEKDPTAILKFRFKSATSMDWDDDIPAVEVKGLLQAVAAWQLNKAAGR